MRKHDFYLLSKKKKLHIIYVCVCLCVYIFSGMGWSEYEHRDGSFFLERILTLHCMSGDIIVLLCP